MPVYSYAASAVPERTASRAPIDPWMLVLSMTRAPAASKTMPIIWPRTICSVNSFEVTVRWAPVSGRPV